MLNRKKTAGLLGAVMAGICLVFVGLYTYISSQSFMETAASQAGRMATELLATKVDFGRVEIVSWRELKVEGLDVYDKNLKSWLMWMKQLSGLVLGLCWTNPLLRALVK